MVYADHSKKVCVSEAAKSEMLEILKEKSGT